MFTVFDWTVKFIASLNSILNSSYPASASTLGRSVNMSTGTSGAGASGSGSASPMLVTEPLAPGSWTMMRSSPNIWMIGSSVPNRLTRPVIFSNTPCIWSKVGSGMTLV